MANQSTSNKKQAQKEEPKEEVKSVECNLDKSFSIPESQAKSLVMFELTDYSSPVTKDVTKERKFQVVRRTMSESNFVKFFKSNYENDSAFVNVNTSEKIYRIQKNLTVEDVETKWADKIFSATGGKPEVKRKFVQELFEEKKKIRLMGGLQMITKFIHVPGLENVDVNKLP